MIPAAKRGGPGWRERLGVPEAAAFRVSHTPSYSWPGARHATRLLAVSVKLAVDSGATPVVALGTSAPGNAGTMLLGALVTGAAEWAPVPC